MRWSVCVVQGMLWLVDLLGFMQISKPSSEEFPRSEVKENLTWTPQRSLHAKQIELNLLTPLLMCCVHIYRDTFVNFTVGNTNIKNHVRISAHSCKLHAFGRKKGITAPSVGLSGLMHFNSLGTSFKFRTWLKCQHQQIKNTFLKSSSRSLRF